MARLSTAPAPLQASTFSATHTPIPSPRPLTPGASMDGRVTANDTKETFTTISDLQEQIRHLQASFDDLVSSSRSSKPDTSSPGPSDPSSPTTSPDALTPPGTPLPPASELEDKPSHLYTVEGTERDYPVYACTHCAPGEVLIPEELLEEVQHKLSCMASRGHKAVQGQLEARKQLHLVRKQCHQLAQTLSSATTRSRGAEEALRQSVRSAERAKGLAEQVNADMLAHWNASLWEVATLRTSVKAAGTRAQQLESQMKLETNARAAAEEEATALKKQLEAAETQVMSLQQQLSSLEATTATLRRDLADQQNPLFVTRRHHETQMRVEVDTRTTAERESETLLTRLREVEGRFRGSADTNSRLEAEIQAHTTEIGGLREVERHCAALQAARNDDAMRMNAILRRNAYLEERLSVYEDTRSALPADNVSLSDSMSTTSRGYGQGWGLGSLRGLRRRGADEGERISLEDLV